MSTGMYIGINNTAHKVKSGYIGVNNVSRKIKRGYIGINGTARLFYSAEDKLKASGSVNVSSKYRTTNTGIGQCPYVGKYGTINKLIIDSNLTVMDLDNNSYDGNTNKYIFRMDSSGGSNSNPTATKTIFHFRDSNLTETISSSLSTHHWLSKPNADATKLNEYSIIPTTNYYGLVYAITNLMTIHQLSSSYATLGSAVGAVDQYQMSIGGMLSGYRNNNITQVYNANMTRSLVTMPIDYPGSSFSSAQYYPNCASTDLGVIIQSYGNGSGSACFINKQLTVTNISSSFRGPGKRNQLIGFKTLTITTRNSNVVDVMHVDTMTTENVQLSRDVHQGNAMSHNEDSVFIGAGYDYGDDNDTYYYYICGLKLS